MAFTAADLIEDMNDKFLASGFQESIIYTPSGGTAKTINAIIYRDGSTETVPSRRTGASENKTISRSYKLSISISADPDEGQDVVTIKKDTVQLYRNPYDSARQTFLVRGIIEADGGAYLLGLGN